MSVFCGTRDAASTLDVRLLRQSVAFYRGVLPGRPDAVVQQLLEGAPSGDVRPQVAARLRNAAAPEDLDLLGAVLSDQPYKAVAAGLGLSLRQFFRRRDALLARLARALSTHAITANFNERLNDANTRIEMAHRLLQKGFVERAQATLTELINDGIQADMRSVALVTRARALLEQGDEAGAAADVRLAGTPAAAGSGFLLGESLFLESFVQYRRANFRGALHHAERAATLFKRMPVPTSPSALRRRVAQLHFLAVLHQEGGSCARSVQVFLNARELLYAVPDSPRQQLAENLALCAISRLSVPNQLSIAWREALGAIDIARRHSLDREDVWANVALAMVANAAGTRGTSLAAARTALAIARECLSGDELCRILTVNSRIEINSNNVGRAVEHLRDIQALRPKLGRLMSGITFACEAGIYEAAHDRNAAYAASTEAIRMLDPSESHYVGLAYKTRARIIPARAQASEDIGVAIGYLRKGASAYDLAEALELSAELTGDKKHRAEALEIRAEAII